MAIGARTRAAEFVRREANALDADADEGLSTGLNAPPRASTSTLGPIRGAEWAITETPSKPQKGSPHACPGALEACAASLRGPGHVHSPWAG